MLIIESEFGNGGGSQKPVESSEFVKSFELAHLIAIGKSLYFHLLFGKVICADDFDSVISICTEKSIDIDITNYLNAQTLLLDCSRY